VYPSHRPETNTEGQAAEKARQPVLFIWSVGSVWSIWFLRCIRLVWFNQIDETDKIDPTDQIDPKCFPQATRG
jgi:hypothetical protein